jgi:hypothetical protein
MDLGILIYQKKVPYGQKLHDCTSTGYLKESNSQRQKIERGMLGTEEKGSYLVGTELKILKMKPSGAEWS